MLEETRYALKVYCDSSIKEACYILGNEPPCFFPYGKEVTNNEGEYYAVIVVARALANREVWGATILSDSKLVVEQIRGNYRCQAKNLQQLMVAARHWLASAGAILEWCPRKENLAGLALEKR